jgi:hypothetical protein
MYQSEPDTDTVVPQRYITDTDTDTLLLFYLLQYFYFYRGTFYPGMYISKSTIR